MNWVFQNPWMLFWALAAAVPLILYLIRRRTVQRVEWAATRFLHQAPRRTVSRKRYKRWLLLVVQMALPVLVALAAASPGCLQPEKTQSRLNSTTHWILVFDLSASMGPDHEGVSSLQTAMAKAKDVIRNASQGDLFSIVTSEANFAMQVVRATASPSVAIKNVETLETDDGTFQLTELVNSINEVVSQSRSDLTNTTDVRIYSDFSNADWSAEFWQSLSNLDATNVNFKVCRNEDDGNIAITNLSADRGHVTAGQTFRCQVEITNSNINSIQDVLVQIMLNDRLANQIEVSVAASNSGVPENATVEIVLPAIEPGVLEIVATIKTIHAGPVADDRRYLTVDCQDDINVVCVEQNPGEMNSLVAAISSDPGGQMPIITTNLISLNDIQDVNLDQVDVVILPGFSQINQPARKKLRDFTTHSGSILLTMGPNIDTAATQSLIDELISQPNIIELENETGEGEFFLEPLGYTHPVLHEFRNFPRAGIVDAPVYRYHKVKVDSDRVDRILNFDNGAPAVFTIRCGRGNLIVTTTPFTSIPENLPSSNWNDLTAWWSYVPLVNEIIFWTFHDSDNTDKKLVGHSVHPNQLDVRDAEKIVVEFPDESESTLTSDLLTQPSGVGVKTSYAGFLRFRFLAKGSNLENQTSVAVNIDPSESLFAVAEMTALRNQVAPTSEPAEINSGTEISRASGFYFGSAALIILLLLVEPFLSGQPRSSYGGVGK